MILTPLLHLDLFLLQVPLKSSPAEKTKRWMKMKRRSGSIPLDAPEASPMYV